MEAGVFWKRAQSHTPSGMPCSFIRSKSLCPVHTQGDGIPGGMSNLEARILGSRLGSLGETSSTVISNQPY